mgnify:FL=1
MKKPERKHRSKFKQELLAREAQERDYRSSMLFRAIIQLLSSRTAKTYLRHIPAHRGRIANEKADNLAGLAVEVGDESQAIYCPVGNIKSLDFWEMVRLVNTSCE